jgi:hypothetical protein
LLVDTRGAEGVLLTGVYGSGKSSVAEEIAYLLEQRGEPYALLDLDYLSWAGTGTDDRAAEFGLMLQNLAAVAANYRRAGIRLFVLAYFVRSPGEVQDVREALGLPVRVVRLTVQLPAIERRCDDLPRVALGCRSRPRGHPCAPSPGYPGKPWTSQATAIGMRPGGSLSARGRSSASCPPWHRAPQHKRR